MPDHPAPSPEALESARAASAALGIAHDLGFKDRDVAVLALALDAFRALPRTPVEAAREAFTVAALDYARCRRGLCEGECHGEIVYGDAMLDAYSALLAARAGGAS